jgi:hypothetical protein
MVFISDLNFGKKYEELSRSLIPEDETIIEIPKGKFKPYDYKTNLFTYETKADRMAYKYNFKTMFIEYECNGVGSGITTTKADYWFYFMVKPDGSHIVYEIPTQRLKDACKDCKSLSGGDGGRVRGYIVPVLDEFKI